MGPIFLLKYSISIIELRELYLYLLICSVVVEWLNFYSLFVLGLVGVTIFVWQQALTWNICYATIQLCMRTPFSTAICS